MDTELSSQVVENPNLSSVVSPTIPQTEEPKPKNNDIKIRILMVLVVILVVLLSGSIYIILSKSENGVGTTSVTQESIKTGEEELFYQRDGELWFLGKAADSKQVTNTNQGIYTFEQSSDSSIVAFVAGEKTTNVNNYTYVIPNAAYIYSANTDKVQKIYELTPKNFPNEEYSITIKDVGVSKDGAKVAVTTSDSLLVYDVQSEKLETIFSFPIGETRKISEVFAYSDPMFSPDNSKVLFKKGYYEGSSWGYVTLNTKEVKDLPYQGYTAGQMVLGWLDNSSLVINEYEGGDTENSTAQIKIAELLSPENSLLVSQVDGMINVAFVASNKVYAVESHQKANYDVYPGTGTPYFENYFSIYEFDLQAKTKKELNTIKQEVFKKDAVLRLYLSLKLSMDGKKLYISGQSAVNTNPPSSPNYTPVIMVLDLVTGGEPVEIVQNASF